MIVDSSAIIALVLEEPEVETVRANLRSASHVRAGAPTLLETGIVLRSRLGPRGRTLHAVTLGRLELETLAFDGRHWPVALDAFTRFGKRRHPAGLNFGDCFAYGLAKVTGEPLLFKGGDFGHTDVNSALAAGDGRGF